MGTEKNGRRPLDGVMLPRLPDWRPRLDSVISVANRRPWQWGVHDCLAVAAEAVLAVTGSDLFEPFRGKYATEAQATTLVPDVAAFMADTAQAQGWPQIPPCEALDGDLALFQAPGGRALVAVVYGRLAFPDEPAGLRTLPRAAAATIWAVGTAVP